jgi:4-amino-4-deoxy-L-arabinose transferase-like glycosyltransferase
MPRHDWAFYLLGILLAAAALWIGWRLAGRYLAPDKRVLGIALLSLLPFYNFHALTYNVSSVLTPFWAATTWCFLLSFETRRAGFVHSRRRCRRRGNAGQILVDFPARRTWARGAMRSGQSG